MKLRRFSPEHYEIGASQIARNSGNPQVAIAVFFIEFRQSNATPHQRFCRRLFCSLPPPLCAMDL
jgi:hypothetical protein